MRDRRTTNVAAAAAPARRATAHLDGPARPEPADYELPSLPLVHLPVGRGDASGDSLCGVALTEGEVLAGSGRASWGWARGGDRACEDCAAELRYILDASKGRVR